MLGFYLMCSEQPPSESLSHTELVRRYGTMVMSLGPSLVKSYTTGNWSTFTTSIKKFDQFKGPIIKIMQFLSLDVFFIPPDIRLACRRFYQDLEPIAETEAERVLQDRLGPNWRLSYRDFNLKAFAAASLGQVHRATLTTGESVAVKMQYPKIAEIAKADIVLFNLFTQAFLSNMKIKPQKLKEIMSEFIAEETDYVRECNNQNTFRAIFEGSPSIGVPKTYPERSTRQVLVMDFVEGQSLDHFYDAPVDARNYIAQQFIRAFFYPLIHHNILYVDTHPGNFLFDERGQKLWMLDFGCTMSISPIFKNAIFDFIHGKEDSITALLDTGDDEILKKRIIENRRIFYKPFFIDDTFIFEDKDYLARRKEIEEIMAKIKACNGFVSMTKEFFAFIRATDICFYILYNLNPQLNYRKTLLDCFNP